METAKTDDLIHGTVGNKVYIVTSGEYSDYGVVAAFNTEEQAKLYCAIHENSLDCPGILELEIENVENAGVPVMLYWVVRISDDGRILSKQSRYTIKDKNSVVCKGRASWGNITIYEVCFTVAEEKGVDVIDKIARDRLAKYKYNKLVEEMHELKSCISDKTE